MAQRDPAVLADVYAEVWYEGKLQLLFRPHTQLINNKRWLPGGKRLSWETPKQALARELYEELRIGVSVNDLKLIHVCRRGVRGTAHYRRDLYYRVGRYTHVPINAEPDNHGELEGFAPDELPDDIVPHNKHALEQIALGKLRSELGQQWLEANGYAPAEQRREVV